MARFVHCPRNVHKHLSYMTLVIFWQSRCRAHQHDWQRSVEPSCSVLIRILALGWVLNAAGVLYRLCLQWFTGNIASNEVFRWSATGAGCSAVAAWRLPGGSRYCAPFQAGNARLRGCETGDLHTVSRFETSIPFPRVGFGCLLWDASRGDLPRRRQPRTMCAATVS